MRCPKEKYGERLQHNQVLLEDTMRESSGTFEGAKLQHFDIGHGQSQTSCRCDGYLGHPFTNQIELLLISSCFQEL